MPASGPETVGDTLDIVKSEIDNPKPVENLRCSDTGPSSAVSRSGSTASAMDESVASASILPNSLRTGHSVYVAQRSSPSLSPAHLQADERSTQIPVPNDPVMDNHQEDCHDSSSEGGSLVSKGQPIVERGSPVSLGHSLPQHPSSSDVEESKLEKQLAHQNYKSSSSYSSSSHESSAESDAYEPPEPDASAESAKLVYSPRFSTSSLGTGKEVDNQVLSPKKSYAGRTLTEASQASAVERRPQLDIEVLGV